MRWTGLVPVNQEGEKKDTKKKQIWSFLDERIEMKSLKWNDEWMNAMNGKWESSLLFFAFSFLLLLLFFLLANSFSLFSCLVFSCFPLFFFGRKI
jgi:hypothetical protein